MAGVERERVAEGSGIKFTKGKDLTRIVIPQYKAGFLRLMSQATELVYGGLGWGDAEMQQLVGALSYAHGNGSLPKLKELNLHSNQIGDAGVSVLAISDWRFARAPITHLVSTATRALCDLQRSLVALRSLE